MTTHDDDAKRRGISRRGLIGGGAAAAGVVGAFAVGRSSEGATGEPAGSRPASYAFRGQHQAGIVTPAQDRLHFAAFDVTTDDRDRLVDLLKQWTEAAERMTAGKPAGPVGPVEGPALFPPDDTGEAIGLPPGRAHDHLRLRTVAVPGRQREGPVRPGRPAAGGAAHAAALPGGRARPGALVRRPVHPGLLPTTRRSRCTRSATWPGSASAPSPCAGRSSASGVRRPPRPASPRRGTCSASRTAP